MMLQKKLRSTRSFQAEGAFSEGITDRFSNLPDEVAHLILSFLTFEDLTRVGTVSKRCRKFYVSAPSVNFDASQARTNQKQVELMSSLDRYLFHRGDNKLQRFSVFWNFFKSKSVSKLSDEHFRIITWIHNAVRCNVEVLNLYFLALRTTMFALPSCVFLSQSLKSLSVCCSGVILQAPSLSFSCNLLSLRLSCVNIVDESFFKWISFTCKCLKEIQLLRITGIERITIESLSLESFGFFSVCGIKLLHLSISVLSSLCKAKVLILNEKTIKALHKEGSMPASLDIFHFGMHLRSLNDALVPAAACLLKGMPNLNTLDIKSKPPRGQPCMSSGFDMGYWKLQNLAFIYHLEEVTIELSNGSNEIEFVRYILEHAVNLKKIVILFQSRSRQSNDVLGKQACLFFLGNYTFEMGILDPADEPNLTQLLEEVTASVKADMEEIKNLLLDLQDLNKETKSSQC
ncbi:putative F-box/FBD/LRR-repeat protein [Prunus yedoensis var. nudiflora]|uniref:Putative F-box/FBD/LRR-repeat protein n=1 Tax=Prunus yedoensis var. nudiflora TaxID=2094558 RepID=A0A314YJ49_PRUYE|nr:putative F-box/FBD/LRR-repeat protein [Prunus yedoensis var. nudiflora]